MMRIWKQKLSMGTICVVGVLLSGCEQAQKWLPKVTSSPEVVRIDSAPVVKQDGSVSLFAAACRGTHPHGGLQITGATRHVVTVQINELIDGVARPVHRISGPANFTKSSVVSAQYLPTQNATCSGAALETIVYGNNPMSDSGSSHDQIEWRLEFAPKANAAYGMDVFQLAGKISSEFGDGSGGDEVPFYADGRQFVADIKVSPGPGYYAEMAQRFGDRAKENAPNLFARPMPDEQPYRTLRLDTPRR